MNSLKPFERFDHGRASADLHWLRDMVRARVPSVEIGSSGAGEITLRSGTERRKPITIYASPPGGYRQRNAHTWRLEVWRGESFHPANRQDTLARVVALLG
jgi:hypothetical protein